jgi:hypothetical protein
MATNPEALAAPTFSETFRAELRKQVAAHPENYAANVHADPDAMAARMLAGFRSGTTSKDGPPPRVPGRLRRRMEKRHSRCTRPTPRRESWATRAIRSETPPLQPFRNAWQPSEKVCTTE